MSVPRPQPGAPRPFRFPAVRTVGLDNGLTVMSCDVPGRPMAAATLLVEAGASVEPEGREGIAALAAACLAEGTEGLPGEAFVDALERIGADFHAGAGWETITASVRVPVARLEPALELMAEAILRPAFPAAEVERVRAQTLNRMRQADAQPMARASRELRSRIYAAPSRQALPQDGRPETVEPLGRDDAAAYFGVHASPGSATLIVAGDLGGADPAKMAERLFGGWTTPEPQRVRRPVAESLTATAVVIVDKPAAVQSNFALGHVGIARSAPDHDAVEVMAHALGGSFSSRINLKLREEKGYTYGARGGFSAGRDPGPFSVQAPVEASVTAAAIEDAITELRRAVADGFTLGEIDAARDNLAGTLGLRFETPDGIAGGLAELVVQGLPLDAFDTYGERVRALTVGDVAAAARDNLRPDRLSICLVGDASRLTGDLEPFGSVEVV